MADADEVQRLRDEVARLVTKNIALEEELRALRATVAEIGLGEVGRSTAASLSRANAALAAEAPPGSPRWTVAEMSAEVRGVLTARGEEIALRVPLAEQPVPAEQLGAVRLTLRQSPRAATTPSVAPSDISLRDAVARLQATAGRWPAGRGTAAAQRIVEQATMVLGLSPDRLDEMIPLLAELTRGAAALAQQAGGTTLRPRLGPYREALKRLQDASATLPGASSVTGPEATAMAASIAELSVVLEDVVGD
jgi:hypothetical protein